jgi:S-DNA-T family DNA segregation ATPase FtsK/SpoIIIE
MKVKICTGHGLQIRASRGKFSIGYNRAVRLMDQIERAGIVGSAQGSKPREVFIFDEHSLEKLLDGLR